MDKYYFVTYQATNKQGGVSVWNQLISDSPMYFIKQVENMEYEGRNNYTNFVVINTLEISEEEYYEWLGKF